MRCKTKGCLMETKNYYCAACKARWGVEKRRADEARAKSLKELGKILEGV